MNKDVLLDENVIAEIEKLIHHRQIGTPYSHNVLERIKALLDKRGI